MAQKKSHKIETLFCVVKFVTRTLQGSQSSSWNLFEVLGFWILGWVFFGFWGFFVCVLFFGKLVKQPLYKDLRMVADLSVFIFSSLDE